MSVQRQPRRSINQILIKEQNCYFDLEHAAVAATFVEQSSLQLPENDEYYLKSDSGEMHIYGYPNGIDQYSFRDQSESGPVSINGDQIIVTTGKSDVRKIILHQSPLNKSSRFLAPPAIDYKSVPFAAQLLEIHQVKANSAKNGGLSIESLDRIKALLEEIQQISNDLKGVKTATPSTAKKKSPSSSNAPSPRPKTPTRRSTPAPDPFSSRSFGGG